MPGGAENAVKSLIAHLKPHFDIEVLTTCVKDFHSDWNENFWKEGEYHEMDIVIRRFKVRKRDTLHFDLINAKLMRGAQVSPSEEQVFISECVRSESLNAYIHAHQNEYQWFLFIPYMFGTTYDGVLAVPEKAILIPCLHDESYAYMTIYQTLFKKVQKALFLSITEKKIAEKLFPTEKRKFIFAGLGLDTDITVQKGAFRKKYGLGPFMLYAGRKDSTKNIPELIAFFDRFQRETHSNLKLVLVGPGEVVLPKNPNIIDLGFVSKEDKYDAMADSFCLCNPSHNESFSIVIMESWLCGRPVLVSEDCAVTRDHVLSSNGGLFYSDYDVFAESLRYYQDHPQESSQMAQNGKKYVMDHFSWDTVAQNYLNALHG